MFGDAPVDDEAIVAAIADGWEIVARDLEYAAVGFGSFHWWLTTAAGHRVFVTLDDVTGKESAHDRTTKLNELEAAFASAAALAAHGHPFVRGPMPTPRGDWWWYLDSARMLTLWPYVEGRGAAHGAYGDDEGLRRAVLRVLYALHATPVAVVSRAHRETFAIENREFLGRVVDGQVGAGWDQGPYGAPARQLAEEDRGAIGRLCRHYDSLVAQAPPAGEWVVTHGEPHAANVVVTPSGPVLIDWDTALIAPRERDLWMVVSGRHDIDEAYAGDGDLRPEMLRLYDARWTLGELGGYLRHFHGPHGDDPDTSAAWVDLQRYLPLEVRWPEIG